MMREQSVASDTSIPDPLNILAKRIGERDSTRAVQRKVTAKELLTILMPVHKPDGCLPVIRSAEKCNKLNDDVEKPFGDFMHSNNDRKVDENLKKVFSHIEEEIEEEEEEENGTQCCSSLKLDLGLSFDGKWLKKYFKSPLKMAIKEIVSKKPYDPVSYLGCWLLNYRKCQELKQLHLEKDKELNYYRSLIEEPISIGEEVSVGRGEEEEEEMRDWNFKHYDAAHIVK